MLTKQDILNTLKQERARLADDFHISEIGLFGSFSRDEQTPDSDIDLLLEIDSTDVDLYELKNELRQYLSSLFNRRVELARKKYLKPYARQDIINEVIYV